MKKFIQLSVFIFALISFQYSYAQDTLHFDFANTQTVPDKAMNDKIVAWGKTLDGKKQDIKIIAYYHKPDFKKYAQARLDEMFLTVTLKVRDLVDVKEQAAKKGENYQRVRVDIIYVPAGTDMNLTSKESKKESKESNKQSEEKKDDKKAGNDSKVAKSSGKKGDEGKVINYDSNKEYLDTTYVNGVMKVTKRKRMN